MTRQDKVLVLANKLGTGSMYFILRQKYKGPAGDPSILSSLNEVLLQMEQLQYNEISTNLDPEWNGTPDNLSA